MWLFGLKSQSSKILLYAHKYPEINYFFVLIGVFFDAETKSEIRIFRTALVFEL